MASSKKNKEREKNRRGPEKVVSWYFNKSAHVQPDSQKRERDEYIKSGLDYEYADNAIGSMFEKEDHKEDLALAVWYTECVDFSEPAHMVMEDRKMSEDKVPITASIGNAGDDTVKVQNQGKCKERRPEREGTENLKGVRHLPNITHTFRFCFLFVCQLSQCVVYQEGM